MFCYNCAAEGHYGDECPSSRPPLQAFGEGSVFSISSLPENYKLDSRLAEIVNTKRARNNGSRAPPPPPPPPRTAPPPTPRQPPPPPSQNSNLRYSRDDYRRNSNRSQHLQYDADDRQDWLSRRRPQQNSHSPRGSNGGGNRGGRPAVVSGSVSLAPSKGNKFKQRYKAGKEAVKRLLK